MTLNAKSPLWPHVRQAKFCLRVCQVFFSRGSFEVLVSRNVSKCYFSSLDAPRRKCNISGLWSKYDPQIEWACENFNSSPYKGYNNICCYICNPGLASTQTRRVIDTGNVTGVW